MSVQVQTKAVVSVAEMARMCGLSRARFYQLVNEGVFPPPLYRIETRRPFFTQEMQETCLEVRRRNCGINGRPVLFYARRLGSPIVQSEDDTAKEFAQARRTDRGPAGARADDRDDRPDRGGDPTDFPNGKSGVDDETVLRTVFLHLKRQDSGDNVGR